jgi:nitrogen fixation/metabolism regulation signal transduction histidine kinase
MKTAIQELIEHFDDFKKHSPNVKLTLDEIINYLKDNLEKEKEQIIHSGNTCGIKAILYKEKLDEMSENELIEEVVKNTITHGEEYFNETYSQK